MPLELEQWLSVKKRKNRLIVIILMILALDFLIYGQILAINFQKQNLQLYFLNVGQGDSELVILPGNVKILIDGGPPNGKVLEALSEILPPTDRYLDLVIISHPQLDHFGGLIEVLKRYQVGMLIHNGRGNHIAQFDALRQVIKENKIKTIRLAAGDKINYLDSVIKVLSPDEFLVNDNELNETSLVLLLISKNTKSLFTGDIGSKTENRLVNVLTSGIDILKVAHHGSKFSSTLNFLKKVKPELAIIEVGENIYNHPAIETLNRFKMIGAKIYRTDEEGIIKLVVDGENIKIIK